MWQTINLTDFAHPVLIDAQFVKFNLSAWLGGLNTQDDNAQVSIVLMNQANQVLLSGITIGPVLVIDRSSQTALLYRQTNGFVPVNARQATVIVTMTRVTGTACNSDADNIALNLYL
jgi:ligand-binding sensor protein